MCSRALPNRTQGLPDDLRFVVLDRLPFAFVRMLSSYCILLEYLLLRRALVMRAKIFVSTFDGGQGRLFYICTFRLSIGSTKQYDPAAHSRPCTALCPPVRLTCLHHALRRCICFFSGSSLQTPSWEQEWERSRRCRAEQLETASLDCSGIRSPAHTRALLSSLRARARHDSIRSSVIAGRASTESQAPLQVSGQKLAVKAPSSFPTLPCDLGVFGRVALLYYGHLTVAGPLYGS